MRGQISSKKVNSQLATLWTKSFYKSNIGFWLKNATEEALYANGHIATGALLRSVNVLKVNRRKVSDAYSASNIYSATVKMKDYGYKLNDGFVVDTPSFGQHYKAIERWAKAKQGVPDDPVFIGRVTSSHMKGKEIVSGWFDGGDGAIKNQFNAVDTFFKNVKEDLVVPKTFVDAAAEQIFQEIYRVFPKEIGIKK